VELPYVCFIITDDLCEIGLSLIRFSQYSPRLFGSVHVGLYREVMDIYMGHDIEWSIGRYN